MSAKTTILNGIALILIIGTISFGIKRYEKQDKFQLKNIDYKNVSYLEIMNRGFAGKPAIYFHTRDSINLIAQQLVASPVTAVDGINWKNNAGACEIVLHYPDGRLAALAYFDMKAKGSIISSGAYSYRNDTLLKMFKAKFKGDR